MRTKGRSTEAVGGQGAVFVCGECVRCVCVRERAGGGVQREAGEAHLGLEPAHSRCEHGCGVHLREGHRWDTQEGICYREPVADAFFYRALFCMPLGRRNALRVGARARREYAGRGVQLPSTRVEAGGCATPAPSGRRRQWRLRRRQRRRWGSGRRERRRRRR